MESDSLTVRHYCVTAVGRDKHRLRSLAYRAVSFWLSDKVRLLHSPLNKNMNNVKINNAVSDILDHFTKLTEEERMAVLYNLAVYYCLTCGKVLMGRKCYCWNDE